MGEPQVKRNRSADARKGAAPKSNPLPNPPKTVPRPPFHAHTRRLTYDELLAHVLKPHPMGNRVTELANAKSEVERWSKDQLEAVHDDWHSE